MGNRRVPLVEAISTSAPPASSGGRASPAGDAVPRLPPTVPRLRICGEPTVREAAASPGSRSPSSAMMREYVTPAPTRSQTSVCDHSVSSGTRVRSSTASGWRWSKLSSTMTSVPPAIGSASGRSAFIARASCQLTGRKKSNSGLFRRRPPDGRLDQAIWPVGGIEHLEVVRHAERRQIDKEMVLVGHLEPDLVQLGPCLQHCGGHLEEGLLQ